MEREGRHPELVLEGLRRRGATPEGWRQRVEDLLESIADPRAKAKLWPACL